MRNTTLVEDLTRRDGLSGGRHSQMVSITRYRSVRSLYPSASVYENESSDHRGGSGSLLKRTQSERMFSGSNGFYSKQHPRPPPTSRHAKPAPALATMPSPRNLREADCFSQPACGLKGSHDRDRNREIGDSISLLEKLEQLERHADDEDKEKNAILAQESMMRLSSSAMSSTRSQQLSQFESLFEGDKIGLRKVKDARRSPTTKLYVSAAAHLNCPQLSSSKADNDMLLASALQQEEDDYAASLRTARHCRQEERRQLVMGLIEQISGAPFTPAYRAPVLPDEIIEYKAPETIDPDEASDFALVNHSSQINEEEICPICLESLSNGLIVALRQCSHLFHLDCLDDLLQQSRRCPHCRTNVRILHAGTSPTGTMKITRPVIQRDKTANGAYVDKQVIEIKYIIPDGEQKEYHDRPGEPFKGTIKVAHLPTNSHGTSLLKRLIFAFSHGMIFRITKSSDGRSFVVNWASVPHSFSLRAMEFDSVCLANCNEALDQLGVPTSFKENPYAATRN